MSRICKYPHYSEYVALRRLPWADILKDIETSGKCLSEIRELIGLPWSTISRYKRGTEPKHSVATAILDLHQRYCGEELTHKRIGEASIITQLR